jgi:hypothetical protein
MKFLKNVGHHSREEKNRETSGLELKETGNESKKTCRKNEVLAGFGPYSNKTDRSERLFKSNSSSLLSIDARDSVFCSSDSGDSLVSQAKRANQDYNKCVKNRAFAKKQTEINERLLRYAEQKKGKNVCKTNDSSSRLDEQAKIRKICASNPPFFLNKPLKSTGKKVHYRLEPERINDLNRLVQKSPLCGARKPIGARSKSMSNSTNISENVIFLPFLKKILIYSIFLVSLHFCSNKKRRWFDWKRP